MFFFGRERKKNHEQHTFVVEVFFGNVDGFEEAPQIGARFEFRQPTEHPLQQRVDCSFFTANERLAELSTATTPRIQALHILLHVLSSVETKVVRISTVFVV